MSEPRPKLPPAPFLRLWAGEMLSVFGTQLTAFALGVWALQQSGSASWYATFAFAATAPRFFAAPWAGVLVDRRSRRGMLLFGHLAAGGCSLITALLFLGTPPPLPLVAMLVASASLLSAAQYPAFQASTVLLVPAARLGRANGMVHLGFSTAYTLVPVIAGALLVPLGVSGVLLIDVATFLLAAALLTTIDFPKPPKRDPGKGTSGPLQEFREGWEYLRDRPGLRDFMILVAWINLILGAAHMLITPLVLPFADEATLGRVLSVAGLGMLVGSVCTTIWGGPKPSRILGVVAAAAVLQAVFLAFTSLRAAAWWIACGMFGVLFLRPLISACSATIWQRKVAVHVQGRVFALRSMVVQGMLPIAYVIAGPAADFFFEPWMAADGRFAPILGPILGVGPGRGIAFFLLVLGIALVGGLCWFLRSGSLRNLEAELPNEGLLTYVSEEES